MAILVTFKYEEDPIKIESARLATTLNIDPGNKKRFWNVRLWLYEGLGELNVLRMLYQRSTLVI